MVPAAEGISGPAFTGPPTTRGEDPVVERVVARGRILEMRAIVRRVPVARSVPLTSTSDPATTRSRSRSK